MLIVSLGARDRASFFAEEIGYVYFFLYTSSILHVVSPCACHDGVILEWTYV